jgi:hypothetical protein
LPEPSAQFDPGWSGVDLIDCSYLPPFIRHDATREATRKPRKIGAVCGSVIRQ